MVSRQYAPLNVSLKRMNARKTCCKHYKRDSFHLCVTSCDFAIRLDPRIFCYKYHKLSVSLQYESAYGWRVRWLHRNPSHTQSKYVAFHPCAFLGDESNFLILKNNHNVIKVEVYHKRIPEKLLLQMLHGNGFNCKCILTCLLKILASLNNLLHSVHLGIPSLG